MPVALVSGSEYRITPASLFVPSPRVFNERALGAVEIRGRCGKDAAPCPEGNQPDVNQRMVGWMQLDQHAPRSFSTAVGLTSLLNEDEEIAPGGHLLFAAIVGKPRVFVDAVSFRMDTGPAHRADAEKVACFLLSPGPNLNGRGAEQLEVLATVVEVGADAGPTHEETTRHDGVFVRYSVQGASGAAHGTFPLGMSGVIHHPAPGDWHVTFSCEADGRVLGSGERWVTINPELTGASQ